MGKLRWNSTTIFTNKSFTTLSFSLIAYRNDYFGTLMWIIIIVELATHMGFWKIYRQESTDTFLKTGKGCLPELAWKYNRYVNIPRHWSCQIHSMYLWNIGYPPRLGDGQLFLRYLCQNHTRYRAFVGRGSWLVIQ